jgi:hypothetical protein
MELVSSALLYVYKVFKVLGKQNSDISVQKSRTLYSRELLDLLQNQSLQLSWNSSIKVYRYILKSLFMGGFRGASKSTAIGADMF